MFHVLWNLSKQMVQNNKEVSVVSLKQEIKSSTIGLPERAVAYFSKCVLSFAKLSEDDRAKELDGVEEEREVAEYEKRIDKLQAQIKVICLT